MLNRSLHAGYAGLLLACGIAFFASCTLDADPGADRPVTVAVATAAERAELDFFAGGWFSYYGSRPLDGYRIGNVENIARDLAGSSDLAYWMEKGFDPDNPRVKKGGAEGAGMVQPGAYYLYYYDNFDGFYFGYLAVIHAVNIFPAAESEGWPGGVIIVEYLEHCFPEWADFTTPLRPFFGVYYRVLSRAAGTEAVQMANAVDLEKLTEWSYSNMFGSGTRLPTIHYAVETESLSMAREKFTAGSDTRYINWGVVMPQYRERIPAP